MTFMTRRQVLAVLGALPLASRDGAQTRVSQTRRVILGTTHGFLLEPDGTLQAWHVAARPDGLIATNLRRASSQSGRM